MSPLGYQILNFSVLAVGLGYVLYGALNKHFKKEREDLEAKLKSVSAEYERVRADYAQAETALRNVESKISEIRGLAQKELKFEQERIQAEAQNVSEKFLKDCDVRLKADSHRAKTQVERELLESAVKVAREAVRAELEKKDAAWTEGLLQATSNQNLETGGRKNYASS